MMIPRYKVYNITDLNLFHLFSAYRIIIIVFRFSHNLMLFILHISYSIKHLLSLTLLYWLYMYYSFSHAFLSQLHTADDPQPHMRMWR